MYTHSYPQTIYQICVGHTIDEVVSGGTEVDLVFLEDFKVYVLYHWIVT